MPATGTFKWYLLSATSTHEQHLKTEWWKSSKTKAINGINPCVWTKEAWFNTRCSWPVSRTTSTAFIKIKSTFRQTMTENLHKQGLRFISTYSSAEGRHLSHYLANMLHWRGKMTLDIWNSLSNLCLKPFADRVSQKATPCVHRTTKFIGWLWPHGLHTTTVTVKAVWQVWSRKFNEHVTISLYLISPIFLVMVLPSVLKAAEVLCPAVESVSDVFL